MEYQQRHRQDKSAGSTKKANMKLETEKEPANTRELPFNNMKIYKLIRKTKIGCYRSPDTSCSYEDES
jgi:hypothetical protein